MPGSIRPFGRRHRQSNAIGPGEIDNDHCGIRKEISDVVKSSAFAEDTADKSHGVKGAAMAVRRR